MTRYAIYFMPSPQSALWAFGSSVLGYDAFTGLPASFVDHPALADAQLNAAWTAEPRKYGFHATLKPPFELSPQFQTNDLMDAADQFAAICQLFEVKPLRLAAMGPFLALVPSEPSEQLQALAGDCVRQFDRFRAPLSEHDLHRRRTTALTPRQLGHLDQWGYPYVFEDFRFHMTLSGPLHEEDRTRFRSVLEELYQPLALPLPIDGIAIFMQPDRDSPFKIMQRFAFGGQPAA